MNHRSKPIWVSCFLIIFFVSHSTSCVTANEVEDEREFDYLNNSEKGPRHWGEIKKEWEECKNGTLQSPIDLTDQRVKKIPKLLQMKKCYKPCNATLKNRGHDISVCLGDAHGPLKPRPKHNCDWTPLPTWCC
ncbi:bifunctional monodehydroascorbate reductase and carbonic anhydrase nectarin-3-like isoform X2 [Tripterygium wilfordii]|uniref:Bifunctional monodehydroascorbate reductase and carbonic anhydrase nectarin-3-like isoform X2 n=1 Tax=Tripterygium wilfordii TaxID=458696 RepID=A0A7J7DVV8_TRIWF|nr:bifunctional monodehydroascorbate reductase and carbonic anhydrase nectarin-3-like isoform X2 [Tripterygium wilfordii]